jgi:hypothetical protein
MASRWLCDLGDAVVLVRKISLYIPKPSGKRAVLTQFARRMAGLGDYSTSISRGGGLSQVGTCKELTKG